MIVQGPAAVILEVYKEGAAGQDGRLKVGDQIRECNGIVIHENMVNERICLSLKMTAENGRVMLSYTFFTNVDYFFYIKFFKCVTHYLLLGDFIL